MEEMKFSANEYKKHDYGKMWKHIGISYECKECGKRFPDAKACAEHSEKEHVEEGKDGV